jgi:hypothetical protein
MLMFGEWQNIMIFLWRANESGQLERKKLSFGMHPQLINMDLQEGMVTKSI